MINDYSEVMASFQREFSYLQKCLNERDFVLALEQLDMMKLKLEDLSDWLVQELNAQ